MKNGSAHWPIPARGTPATCYLSGCGQLIVIPLTTHNLMFAAEIPYVQILNRILPEDIRVLAWSVAADDFDAR
jgi:tRNA U38,U39,U40 pseudouridine synthase TruA